MLGKIKKIWADLSKNRLNSGNFITIIHKNSIRANFQLPPEKNQPRTLMNILKIEKSPNNITFN
jgi:hypothetical protein